MKHAAATAELRAAMERLEPEPEHTAHVASLAVQLFDDLKAIHGLGRDERVILEGAAWLHDIGWSVSKNGAAHHKHSARLIRRQKWEHLSPEESNLVALVARYHRKALPCSEHVDFHSLPPERQQAVRCLAALLRLADALDRSHLQHVREVRARVEDDRIEFTLRSRQPPAREIAAAQRKGNLAREVFQRDLSFRIEPAITPLA